MSLNLRIILSATLVLAIFISMTAVTLERAFVESSESALRDKLTSQLYALMAAADVADDAVTMPSSELDALLGVPSSGVYAYVADQHGNAMWSSSSVLGAKLPLPTTLPSGEQRFIKTVVGDVEFYSFVYGVSWATGNTELALSFNIITDLQSFDRQLTEYRTTLLTWLVAMALLLLVTQALILRWGLSPLRKVGRELSLIENGKQQKIEEEYPQEIERLTDNINILLQQEREQKTRYRNALGDLAHSLKTPLAVLQNALAGHGGNQSKDSMQQQIVRMNSIVEYQLQRAATAGAASIGKSVDVCSVIERILESLHKVHQDKSINVMLDIERDTVFKGDEGDLMEVLGNLFENAFKWAQQAIEIKACNEDGKCHISVADDGPGVAEYEVDNILKRGVRADESIAGHGIGLSIVQNIVDAYHGSLKISRSQWNGAEVHVVL
ncbi:MAG: GHKL domain-containing protein [Gammaproteobacteria bacterium]|nr:GHKL domain-containing protein [Gammaproteobacteria bacterium]